MGKLIILATLGSTALAALARPWIGIVAAYVIVILMPQFVWWWHFGDIRPAMMVLAPTILGFGLAFIRDQLTIEPLLNKRSFYLLLLWTFYTVSAYLGPYIDTPGEYRFTHASVVISTIHKIFILYFLACICIDDPKKLKVFAYALPISVVYMVYWANSQYLSGHVWGRLAGPAGIGNSGSYSDTNNFAMLFVVGLPFLWYLGFTIRNRLIRWGMWLVIPFGWHAVFLTGSRGGLVGLGATLALTVWRSNSKKLAILLLPAFVGAYVWQAGDLMHERAATISEYQTESSAQGRLQAWEAALGMMKSHPITGVGLASFTSAFPDFSEHRPREAHNTFLQIAGEAGLIAGFSYLIVAYLVFASLWRIGKKLRSDLQPDGDNLMYWINEAVLVSFFGLIVCSMFLSLQLFEIFFYLCVAANAIIFVNRSESAVEVPAVPKRQRAGPGRPRRNSA